MDRTFIADLHNHTTASDGEYSPTELVNHAAALGLRAVGVTDHDTLNGLDEALAAGDAAGASASARPSRWTRRLARKCCWPTR